MESLLSAASVGFATGANMQSKKKRQSPPYAAQPPRSAPLEPSVPWKGGRSWAERGFRKEQVTDAGVDWMKSKRFKRAGDESWQAGK